MRVCGGRWKGRQLRSLRGTVLRPSTERVKEAIFSILGSRVVGATVADLCCGAGGLGIEALSRGAGFVYFIDLAPAALRLVRANLARCGATADQFVLLSLLAEQDGITQQELVRQASSDPNTVRAMLLLLEKRGVVARGRHPTDGRARRVTLTRKGRQTYDKLLAEIKPLQERLSSLFRAEEAETLVVFLSRISRAMAKLERRRPRRRSTASPATAES